MSTPDTRHIFDESGCINQPTLLAYQRNQLPRAEKHSIEQHLVDCELCSEALEGLALISHEAVLDDVNKSVKNLTRYPSKTFLSPQNKNYFLIAASVTIVAVSTYFVLNFTNSADQSISEAKMEQEAVFEKNAMMPDSKDNESVVAATDSVVIAQPAKSNTDPSNSAGKQVSADKKPIVSGNANALTLTTTSNNIAVPKLSETTVTANDVSFATDQQAGLSKSSAPAAQSESIPDRPVGTDSAIFRSQLKIQNITFMNNLAAYDYPEKIADERKKNDLASERVLESPYETREEKDKFNKEESAKSKRVISYKEKLSSGLAALQNKEYQKALRSFDDLLQENDRDVNALFYSGMANENMLHYAKAIELYSKTESNTETDYFVEAARWHRALCLIQLRESGDAKVILNDLKTNNGFYSRQATDKLKQLK